MKGETGPNRARRDRGSASGAPALARLATAGTLAAPHPGTGHRFAVDSNGQHRAGRQRADPQSTSPSNHKAEKTTSNLQSGWRNIREIPAVRGLLADHYEGRMGRRCCGYGFDGRRTVLPAGAEGSPADP